MMPPSIDPGRRSPATSRRAALALLGAGSVALGLGPKPAQARAEGDSENVLT
jgi:hypothetical protein